MSKEKCIIEGCNGVVKARGLCVSCYQSARAAVKAGKVTWAKLVAAGLAKDAGYVTGKPTLFTEKLAAAGLVEENPIVNPDQTAEKNDEQKPDDGRVSMSEAQRMIAEAVSEPQRSAMGDNPYMRPPQDAPQIVAPVSAAPVFTPPVAQDLPPWAR